MTAPAKPLTIEEKLAKLRAPFPPEVIGKLPRVTCADCRDRKVTCQKHSKKSCHVCGNYISEAHIHLDYIGHAEATDRLLSVDPEWSWEPFSLDGGPALRQSLNGREMNLWIALTVCGITRYGVGSVENTEKTFDAEKQLIGDAIRNAAMRFGMALELWAKTDLESTLDDPAEEPAAPEGTKPAKAAAKRVQPPAQAKARPTSPVEELRATAKAKGYNAADVLFIDIETVTGEKVTALEDLSPEGVEQFLAHLANGKEPAHA